MEINKLPMCRICLVENVRMSGFANTTLQEIYEKLTNIPLVTEDSRPMVACFICYAKLKQCCRFQRKCWEAEELFALMLNKDNEIKPQLKQGKPEFSEYTISPTQHISILDDGQTEHNGIKEELPDVCHGQEEENRTVFTDSEHEYKDIVSVDVSPQHSASGDTSPHHSELDSEDDVPLLKLKIEVEAEEEQELTPKKKIAGNSIRAPGAKKRKLEKLRAELEDTITTQQNKTEKVDCKMIPSTRNLTSKSVTEFKEPFGHTVPITNNNINVTVADNHLKRRYNYCVKCKLSFSTSYDLIKHIRTHTGDSSGKGVSQRDLNYKNNMLKRLQLYSVEKRHVCNFCQRSFSGKNDLIKHMRVHTGVRPYKCDICQCSVSKKDDLTKHIRLHHGEKPYKCDVCQGSFSEKGTLARHSRLHTGEKPFNCDKCQLSFNRKDHLNKHLRRHTDEKPFQCDICGRFYRDKKGLTQHIELHSEKPYKCEICQRLFRYQVSNNHMKKCSGGTCFTCDLCQLSFNDISSLNKHNIEIHVGVQTFKCEVCQRSYATKSALNFHMRKHNDEKPYKCETCQSSFSYAHHLREHILIHTGEKPYKCEICQRGFIKSRYLKVHARMHTGEKPYKCDVCERSFSRPDNLRQHIRTHTGETVKRVRRKVI